MFIFNFKILNNVAPYKTPNDGASIVTRAFGFFIAENKSGGLFV